MLEVSKLNYVVDGDKILADINFAIHPKQVIGLVAPNGTGKTTLLRCITGLIHTDAKILLNEKDSWHNRKQFLKDIFFVEDNQRLFANLTAVEHLQYVRDMWDSQIDVQKVLRVLQMTSYANKRVAKLSLGMRQHVLLAMYMVADTKYMLFDEPLNGLDPTSIKLFNQVFVQLRDQGHGVVMSSHQLDNVQLVADDIMFLKDGSLLHYLNQDVDLKQKYDELYGVAEVQL